MAKAPMEDGARQAAIRWQRERGRVYHSQLHRRHWNRDSYCSNILFAKTEMIATPDRAEARAQIKALAAYLKSCCGVCGIPHDEAVHSAVLRLREPLPERYYLPNPGAQIRHCAPAPTIGATLMNCACGAEFSTLNPRVAIYCPDCLEVALAASRTKSAEKRLGRRKA